jgi:hypothetical protein
MQLKKETDKNVMLAGWMDRLEEWLTGVMMDDGSTAVN